MIESSVKTTSFDVRTVYDSVKDKNHNYISVFADYECSHSLKLSFDFDSARMAEALMATVESWVNPRIDIDFTVKEPNAVNEMILRKAAENARKKAEILCSASGV